MKTCQFCNLEIALKDDIYHTVSFECGTSIESTFNPTKELWEDNIYQSSLCKLLTSYNERLTTIEQQLINNKNYELEQTEKL